MIAKTIIQELAGFYNRKVIFNTNVISSYLFGATPDKKFNLDKRSAATFKIGEEIVGGYKYITSCKIAIHSEFVEVLNIEVLTLNK